MPTTPGMLPTYQDLIDWNLKTRAFPMVDNYEEGVEYHRLQVEYFIWANTFHGVYPRPIIDIGGEWKRPYILDVLNLNHQEYDTDYCQVRPDILASITALPFASGSIGTIICTETLEHVPNLFRAITELRRVLRPRGLLLASTPFMWPDHTSPPLFNDYWRLTEPAWRFLLNDFTDVHVAPTRLRPSSFPHLRNLSNSESYGDDILDRFHTGYLVGAIK